MHQHYLRRALQRLFFIEQLDKVIEMLYENNRYQELIYTNNGGHYKNSGLICYNAHEKMFCKVDMVKLYEAITVNSII